MLDDFEEEELLNARLMVEQEAEENEVRVMSELDVLQRRSSMKSHVQWSKVLSSGQSDLRHSDHSFLFLSLCHTLLFRRSLDSLNC